MVFLTCSVSFRSISCRYFSKWRLKIFSDGNQPHVPLDFDGLPYPHVRGYPQIFFIKVTAKDVNAKDDYVDAGGHFVLFFGAIGNRLLGGVVITP